MAGIKIYTLTDTYIIRDDSIMDNIVLDKYVTETERLTLGSVIASQLSFNYYSDKSIPWDNVRGIEYLNNGQIIFKGYIEEHELEGDVRRIVALDVLSAFDIVVTQEMYSEIFYNTYVSIDDIIRKCIEIANRYTVKFGEPYSTINLLSHQQLSVSLNTPDFAEFETATLRNILQWVCEIIGAVVYTKGVNIVLKSIGNKDVSIKHSEIYSYSHSEKPISVTGIEYTAGEIKGDEIEEKEYFIGTDDKVISLSNNPFLAYNGNHAVIESLLDDLKKYKYYPGVIRLSENSFLRDDIDFLDTITIYDEKNVARLFLVTHIRFSEGSFYELESIGRNWKSAEKNIEGKLNTRKRMRERKSIRQIYKVATELADVAEEARNNYETEKNERIEEAKRLEDLALNSPVTETRIEPNSVATSHLKANAVRADALLVDQALINKITTGKILSEAIWADFIYTRKQAVDLLQAGTIVDQTGNNYWNLTTGEVQLTGDNVSVKVDEEGIKTVVGTSIEEKLSDPETQDKFKGKDGTAFTWNIYKGGAILDKSQWVKYDANGLNINGEEIFFHTAKKESYVMGVYRLYDYNDVLEQGKTYTVSFDAKNLRDDQKVRFTVNGFDVFSYVILEPLEEKRVVITGIRDTERPMQLQATNTVKRVNLKFELRNLKIEEGAVTDTIFTPHPDEVKADYTEFRTEYETELNILSNQISSKVEENTYNSALGAIRTDISKLTQNVDGLTLTMQTKGKYRNTLVGSDNFENYELSTSYYFSTREDGSIEFGISSSSNVSETYFLFPLDRLEYLNTDDKATLLVERLFAGENINKIVFSLADKDKNIVSNAYTYKDNSKIYEFTLTGKPEYLRVVIGRNNINLGATIRFYKETIAVVAGSVPNLTWDMTYINDSATQYKFLKDEFLLSLGNLKTEIKGDINGLTLSGSKITLTGDTKVNGSFKIDANNLSEIGGFTITNNTLTSGSGSSYVRISGATGYTPILVGGTSWDSARFAVSTIGTVKSEGGSFTTGSYSGSSYGYGRFSSGSYTGSGYLYSGSTLAGYSISDSGGRIYSSSGFGGSTMSTGTLYFTRLTSTTLSSQGYTYSATLQDGRWVISNSDIRLKENIEELTDEYNKYIYDLPLIKYNYKSDEKHRPQVGVNANLLMKILPEEMAKSFLHQDEETGLYGANYELLVPYTIKAIQDLNKRLERLENE